MEPLIHDVPLAGAVLYAVKRGRILDRLSASPHTYIDYRPQFALRMPVFTVKRVGNIVYPQYEDVEVAPIPVNVINAIMMNREIGESIAAELGCKYEVEVHRDNAESDVVFNCRSDGVVSIYLARFNGFEIHVELDADVNPRNMPRPVAAVPLHGVSAYTPRRIVWVTERSGELIAQLSSVMMRYAEKVEEKLNRSVIATALDTAIAPAGRRTLYMSTRLNTPAIVIPFQEEQGKPFTEPLFALTTTLDRIYPVHFYADGRRVGVGDPRLGMIVLPGQLLMAIAYEHGRRLKDGRGIGVEAEVFLDALENDSTIPQIDTPKQPIRIMDGYMYEKLALHPPRQAQQRWILSASRIPFTIVEGVSGVEIYDMNFVKEVARILEKRQVTQRVSVEA